MKTEIHPELKKAGVAVRYFKAKSKDYSRDMANKMLNQDNAHDRIDETVLRKVLKELVNEQIYILKLKTKS